MPKHDEIISIGVPVINSTIHMQTTFSLINMVLFSRELKLDFIVTNNTQIITARREISREAQKAHANHLLFIDSDMDFDRDLLKRLLESKKDVVGAYYHQRGLPLLPTVRIKDKSTGIYRVPEAYEMSYDNPFECDATGAGCMLIDMRVFDKIKKPWFSYADDEKNPMGEDIWFCQQVKKAGFQVWCDPTLRVKHIGEYAY